MTKVQKFICFLGPSLEGLKTLLLYLHSVDRGGGGGGGPGGGVSLRT